MALRARYDDIAEWYDETMAVSELGLSGRAIVLRLLGPGPGRLLDVGCGGGSHMLAFAEAGWTPAGVDVSPEQLRLARGRGCGGAPATSSRREPRSFRSATHCSMPPSRCGRTRTWTTSALRCARWRACFGRG